MQPLHWLAPRSIRKASARLILLLPLLITTNLAAAQSFNLANAPEDIKSLAKALEGKKREGVLRVIVSQFGPPARNTGSGVDILEWDIESGRLVFNAATGPYFVAAKTKTAHRLLKTSNPLASNILGSFEMSTLPTQQEGASSYLGYLIVDANLRYSFVEDGPLKGMRADQSKEFFTLHPFGTVQLQYEHPYTERSLLETVPEGAVIARLKFTSANGVSETFLLSSSEIARVLRLASAQAQGFRLIKHWNSDWD